MSEPYDGKDSKCVAVVTAPPWHTHHYPCGKNARFSVGGQPVCGTHRRVAEKWEAQGRLASMMRFYWGIESSDQQASGDSATDVPSRGTGKDSE